MFAGWPDGLPDEIEVWGVQAPGRENRLLETAVASVPGLADEIAPRLATLAGDARIALFGHCLGSLVALEVAQRLEHGSVPVDLLVVSGYSPPEAMAPVMEPLHLKSDDEIVAAYVECGGLPGEVLADRELMSLVLPGLRADARAIETYLYRPAEPVETRILAVGGEDDPLVSQELLALWGQSTRGRFDVTIFPGGHFYLREHQTLLLTEIERALAGVE